jgi:hypothetical protein
MSRLPAGYERVKGMMGAFPFRYRRRVRARTAVGTKVEIGRAYPGSCAPTPASAATSAAQPQASVTPEPPWP